MTSKKSNILVFEGSPLAGKSTQVDLLADYLRSEDYDVEVLKRATEYCPTRERINSIQTRTDDWTREDEGLTAEEETEMWAQYYREKSEAAKEISRNQSPDYILMDRYMLSLIPNQEMALEESVDEMFKEYRNDIESLDADAVFLFEIDEDVIDPRYSEREGGQPGTFREEVLRMQESYQELGEFFDFTEIDATKSKQEVFEQIKTEMKEKGLL